MEHSMTSDATFFSLPSDHQFIVERLADGSAAVFDAKGEAVHSLNQSAAAVWACCAEPATLSQIVEALNDGLSTPMPQESIAQALRQLEGVGMIVRSSKHQPALVSPSRRDALRRTAWGSTGVVALPVVISLLASEQRVHAQGSPALNLTGTWTGSTSGVGGGINFNWTATQSGTSVTGPAVASGTGFSFNGTISGTVSGTTVALSGAFAFVGPPACTITITFTATGATSIRLAGAVALPPGCPPGGGGGTNTGTFILTKS